MPCDYAGSQSLLWQPKHKHKPIRPLTLLVASKASCFMAQPKPYVVAKISPLKSLAPDLRTLPIALNIYSARPALALKEMQHHVLPFILNSDYHNGFGSK